MERKARLIANAVGQQAALRKLFERALVFPAALREHARALEETVGRIHAHARDVVVVDWQHAEQQDPRAANALTEFDLGERVLA